MKPDELFNRIPVVVFEDGVIVERELREGYHRDIIVAYTPKTLEEAEYRGFVITASMEAYALLGTDEIVSHIKANFLKEKIIQELDWEIINKEKFEEYKRS